MKSEDIRNHDNVRLTMLKGVCVDDNDNLCLHANIASFLQPLVFLKRMNICLLSERRFRMNGIIVCPFSLLLKIGNIIFIYASFQSPFLFKLIAIFSPFNLVF
jgi:hypothetical protein